MKTIDWDVIILGAGPAGLALATRLASKKVLLLERELKPASGLRIGESLPGAAQVLLQRLGVFEEFKSGNHLERGAIIAIWDHQEPVWRDSLRDPSGPGWLLDRRQFEQMLLRSAVSKGAQIIYGCHNIQFARHAECWSFTTEGRQHFSPVIVDASGRSASLARQRGLTHRKWDSQICLHSFLPCTSQSQSSCTRILADAEGWWYSVRLPNDHQVLAYHLEAKNSTRQHLQQPLAFLERARQHPFLSEILHQTKPAEVHVRPAGTAILDIENLETAGPGFLAIGDAAITFDPISSQGLFNSLATAESAATAINASCWRNPDALNSFKQELLSVASHYMSKIHQTYGGPKRFADAPFWAMRQR